MVDSETVLVAEGWSVGRCVRVGGWWEATRLRHRNGAPGRQMRQERGGPGRTGDAGEMLMLLWSIRGSER